MPSEKVPLVMHLSLVARGTALAVLAATGLFALAVAAGGNAAKADCLFVVRYHDVIYLPRFVETGHGPLPQVTRSVPVTTPSCEADLPPDTYALRAGGLRAYVMHGVPPSVALLYRSDTDPGSTRLVMPQGASRLATLDALATHPLHKCRNPTGRLGVRRTRSGMRAVA